MTFVNLLDITYPIGSVYFSTEDSSPSGFIGGSWVKLNNEAVIGNGNGYFGSKTISISQIPAHNHGSTISYIPWNSSSTQTRASLCYVNQYAQTVPVAVATANIQAGNNYTETVNQGGGANYLPYTFGCNIWYRTA